MPGLLLMAVGVVTGTWLVISPVRVGGITLDVHSLLYAAALDGMRVEEHSGFDVTETPSVFVPRGLRLSVHRRFQMRLDNLFVFEKVA